MSSEVWGKVYGDLWSHPKFITLDPRAGFLWLKALSYSKAMSTYGVIGRQLLPIFVATEDDAQILVDAGLWIETAAGWRFHDWDDYQTSRERDEHVSQKRSEAGKKGGRPRRQDRPVTSTVKQTETNLVSKPEATVKQDESNAKAELERELEPERETHTPEQGELLATPEPSPRKRGSAYVYPDAFEAFWKAYPRKDDKAKALEVWRRVVREIPNADLIAGAERYRDDPNRTPGQYTKLATSWLNAGAWENGPLPPRGGSSGRPEAGDTHRAMARSYSAAQAYRELEDSGYYDDQPPRITSLHGRRTA